MELAAILELDDGPAKTAALVAWVQGMFAVDAIPILVGGAAVELYTDGGYTTGDIDLVGHIPADVVRKLEHEGFSRQGRFWIHEPGQVFLEFPGSRVGVAEQATWITTHGHRVRVIAVEDLLVDRLGAWQYWKSSIDGANSFILWRKWQHRIDHNRLHKRVTEEGWIDAMASVEEFASRHRNSDPSTEELEAWATRGP